MVKKKKVIVWSVIALLVVALAAWRVWPRSIDSYLKQPSQNTVWVGGSLNGIKLEDGQTTHRLYEIDVETEEGIRDVLDILRRGRYQASLTNLLPWTWGKLGSGRGYDGRTITLCASFHATTPEDAEASIFTFVGSDRATVDDRRIVPMGNETFEELAQYIKANGKEK